MVANHESWHMNPGGCPARLVPIGPPFGSQQSPIVLKAALLSAGLWRGNHHDLVDLGILFGGPMGDWGFSPL